MALLRFLCLRLSDGAVAAKAINGAVRSDFPRSEHAALHLETVNGSIAVTKVK